MYTGGLLAFVFYFQDQCIYYYLGNTYAYWYYQDNVIFTSSKVNETGHTQKPIEYSAILIRCSYCQNPLLNVFRRFFFTFSPIYISMFSLKSTNAVLFDTTRIVELNSTAFCNWAFTSVLTCYKNLKSTASILSWINLIMHSCKFCSRLCI